MMTCKQLGGACEMAFQGSSFDEIAAQSKKHGMQMFKEGDKPHLEAMQAMAAIMQSPAEMKTWMDNKRKEFDALPETAG